MRLAPEPPVTQAARTLPVRRVRRLFGCLPALIALFVLCAPVHAEDVIGHADLHITDLTRNQLRLFFTMRLQQLPDKTQVRVFVLPDDNPVHARFAKAVLGLFPYQLRQVWDRQLYSGTGQAPSTVNSEAEMLARVAATPGAIGYVERLTDQPGVRRLKVR